MLGSRSLAVTKRGLRLNCRSAKRVNVVRAESDRPKTGKGTRKRGEAATTQATVARSDVSPNAQRKSAEANRSILDHPEVEKLVRRTGLHRIDGALLLGDAIMMFTTHVASEKLPLPDVTTLGLVATGCWVCVSQVKGDYNLVPNFPGEEWLAQQPGYSIYVGIREGAFSWVAFVPVVLTAFASLVIHGAVDAGLLMDVYDGARVSPELEVIVASALTVPCWRGIYFAIRDGFVP